MRPIHANAFSGPLVLPIDVVLATVAKIICSAICISGREMSEILYNAVPHALIIHHVDPMFREMLRVDVDKGARRVSVSATIDRQGAQSLVSAYRDVFPGLVADWQDEVERVVTMTGRTRVAQNVDDQGCVILADDGVLNFEPVALTTTLMNGAECDWPMGDRPTDPLPPLGLSERAARAVEVALTADEAATAAVVVVHRGQIVAEHYREGFDADTRCESWSMGKSIVATLVGRLIQEGHLDLDQPAPVAGWDKQSDPRAAITIRHLLQMSSGLRFSGDSDPRDQWSHATSDHFYVYGAAIDVYGLAVSCPAEYPPGTVGRYRNCDPLLLCQVAKRIVEERLGEEFLSWPQRTLFDRIGVRRHVLETDCYGNFVMTGFVYGTARDWARLGLLYLRGGCWQGDRLLPEGWSDFVSTPAPGWERPEFGALFWLNRTGEYDLPRDAYYMGGYGEQRVFIVPSADIVIVRMGLSGDGAPARLSTNRLLRGVTEAIEMGEDGAE